MAKSAWSLRCFQDTGGNGHLEPSGVSWPPFQCENELSDLVGLLQHVFFLSLFLERPMFIIWLRLPRLDGSSPDIISFSTLLAACEHESRWWTFLTKGLEELSELAKTQTFKVAAKKRPVCRKEWKEHVSCTISHVLHCCLHMSFYNWSAMNCPWWWNRN